MVKKARNPKLCVGGLEQNSSKDAYHWMSRTRACFSSQLDVTTGIIRPFPELQLECLETLLNSPITASSLDESSRLQYLSLICKLKPQKVPAVLIEYKLPLESSLRTCEKYGHLLGAAIITVKLQRFEAAARLFSKVVVFYRDNNKVYWGNS